MTESIPEPVSTPASPVPNADRYKTLVVILTVITTVITAVVASLQADANIRASINNRDSQVDAILAAEELHRVGLQFAYDINIFSSYLKDSQEATVLQMTALEQQQSGGSQAGAASRQRAAVSQARADTARKFSVFFTDSRYAPKTADGMPDAQAYLTDSSAAANDMVARQNVAADNYNLWNHKGDSYTSVLTLLAVAFFLFGLAQALSPRLRLLFAIFGFVAMASAAFWTFVILVG
jgi:hypothetical protein